MPDPIEPLTAEQEALVVEHLDYAESGARAWFRRSGGQADLDALISASHLGLMLAVRSWSPTGGASFKSWLFTNVDCYVRREFRIERRANGWTFNYRAKDRAAGKTGMERVLVRAHPAFEGKDGDVIEWDPPAPDTSTQTEHSLHLASLRTKALGVLDKERDREILAARLDGLSHRAIGKRLGMTGSRIQQIEVVILKKVKRRVLSGYVAADRPSAPSQVQPPPIIEAKQLPAAAETTEPVQPAEHRPDDFTDPILKSLARIERWRLRRAGMVRRLAERIREDAS